MKIKEGFMLREVAGNFVVVPVGEASKNFKGIINLNGIGAFIWKALEENVTEEKVVDLVFNTYEVDKERASIDVHHYIEQLRKNNFLDE